MWLFKFKLNYLILNKVKNLILSFTCCMSSFNSHLLLVAMLLKSTDREYFHHLRSSIWQYCSLDHTYSLGWASLLSIGHKIFFQILQQRFINYLTFCNKDSTFAADGHVNSTNLAIYTEIEKLAFNQIIIVSKN